MRCSLALFFVMLTGCTLNQTQDLQFLCSADTQCAADHWCKESLAREDLHQERRCVPGARPTCAEDSPCDLGWICVDDKCAGPTGDRCYDTYDCPQGITCNEEHYCVGCPEIPCGPDEHCENSVCLEGCVPGGCPDEQRCDDDTQRCVSDECAEDCAPNQRCVDHRCVTACAGDGDCGPTEWCDEGGQCASNCGEICDVGALCMDPNDDGYWDCFLPCEDDDQCPPGLLCWDQACQEPRECTSHDECGSHCVNGRCARCESTCCVGDVVHVGEDCVIEEETSCIEACGLDTAREGWLYLGHCAEDGRCATEPGVSAPPSCGDGERCVPVLGERTLCEADVGERLVCELPGLVDDCRGVPDYTACASDDGGLARCVAGACYPWTCDAPGCHDISPGHQLPQYISTQRFLVVEVEVEEDIIHDEQTGLQWRFTGEEVIDLGEALARCDGINMNEEVDIGEALLSPWRVPSLAELLTIAGPETSLIGLWDPPDAWFATRSGLMVNLAQGEAVQLGDVFEVVCVRFAPSAPSPQVNSEERVEELRSFGYDTLTGLRWLDIGTLASFGRARVLCDEEGMRLPSVAELATLLDFRRLVGNRDLLEASGVLFWTRDRLGDQAWMLDTSLGTVSLEPQSDGHQVRCVARSD